MLPLIFILVKCRIRNKFAKQRYPRMDELHKRNNAFLSSRQFLGVNDLERPDRPAASSAKKKSHVQFEFFSLLSEYSGSRFQIERLTHSAASSQEIPE